MHDTIDHDSFDPNQGGVALAYGFYDIAIYILTLFMLYLGCYHRH
jgi:hypothetical protein